MRVFAQNDPVYVRGSCTRNEAQTLCARLTAKTTDWLRRVESKGETGGESAALISQYVSPINSLEEIMLFKVEMDYRKGPSFSVEIEASCEAEAKSSGVICAHQCGFTYPAKKISATELATTIKASA